MAMYGKAVVPDNATNIYYADAVCGTCDPRVHQPKRFGGGFHQGKKTKHVIWTLPGVTGRYVCSKCTKCGTANGFRDDADTWTPDD